VNGERPAFNQLSREQQITANLNRIALAKSDISADAVALHFILYTRQSGSNPERGCWPASDSIAKRMGYSKRRFYAALAVLVELGMVRVEPGIGRRRNTYFVVAAHEWPGSTVARLAASGDNVSKPKNKADGSANALPY
jgi:hypothetical protein